MDTSPFEFTKSISVSLHRCAIERAKSAFRIDNPLLKTCKLRVSKCSFEDCLQVFTVRGWNHEIEVTLSRFTGNQRCFQLFPKDALEMNEFSGQTTEANQIHILNELNQLEAINKIKLFKPVVSSNGLKIANCSFKYNRRVLAAKNCPNPIRFWDNRVVNCLEQAIDVESCGGVTIRYCLFEENYADGLFVLSGDDSDVSKGGGGGEGRQKNSRFDAKEEEDDDKGRRKREKRRRKARIERKVSSPSFVLIKSVQSNIRIRKNQFIRNDGSLIQIGSLDLKVEDLFLNELSSQKIQAPPPSSNKYDYSNQNARFSDMNNRFSQASSRQTNRGDPETASDKKSNFYKTQLGSGTRGDRLSQMKEDDENPMRPRKTNTSRKKLTFLRSGSLMKNRKKSDDSESQTSQVRGRRQSEYLSLIDRHQTSQSLKRRGHSTSKLSVFKNLRNPKIPNASFFQINHSSTLQKTTVNSILDDQIGPLADENVTVTVSKNNFLDNGAVCLQLLPSLIGSYVTVEKNSFVTNFKDLISSTGEGNPQVDILANTFEISAEATEKTVRFEKGCANLKFEDNEFVKLRGPESKPNIWLRLMGCADEEQLQDLDLEPEMVVSQRRSSGKPEAKAEQDVEAYCNSGDEHIKDPERVYLIGQKPKKKKFDMKEKDGLRESKGRQELLQKQGKYRQQRMSNVVQRKKTSQNSVANRIFED